ncbi:hypothetical protein FHP25_23360 [Vineibacter terrae]|uniref:Uncharacterized protein n=2 Tax=Vineibacter terrae TaxID=2586908 RepID=A0A5C8PGR5_9HYPH|nr:hypothetical protein FHP25_23360 [Vineibacter terrae]
MPYVEMPSLQEFKSLRATRADACVSIYLPTTPAAQDSGVEATAFGNLAKQALAQLEAAGFDRRRLDLLAEQFDDLLADDNFWRFQNHSLAVLATPDNIRTFRLANRLQPLVEVADRFYMKPLLRAITFPHHAFVLAISENDVRLVEVLPDLPARLIQVPDLPKNAASAVGTSSLNNRTSLRRVMGAEGQKVRLAQYARKVDAAIRSVLSGKDVPLVLAARDPLAAIFRSVNSHPKLLPENLAATDDRSSEAAIADAARPLLDALYAREVAQIRDLFETRAGAGRTITDIADAARAATFGMIDTLIVDIDTVIHGTVDAETGAVTFSEEGPGTYGVIDETIGRALESGARVLAVRRDEVPGGGALAAILRYAG